MPGKVFISYSREDAFWLERVTEQLAVLRTAGRLEVWDDRSIGAGSDWLPAIEQAMAECHVALLLVSAPFLGSKFITTTEVPALLQRRARQGLRVIPVLVRACPWEKIDWLARIALHQYGGKALSAMRKARYEQVLADLASGIDDLLASVAEAPANATGTRADAPHVDLHNLPEGAADFFGRGADLEWLDAQWQTAGAVSVAVLVAPGGTGKTSVVRRWLSAMDHDGWRGALRVFGWSFYSQGTAEDRQASEEPFFAAALAFFRGCGRSNGFDLGQGRRARPCGQSATHAADPRRPRTAAIPARPDGR